MLYISKTGDYLKILSDVEVKDLVVINFNFSKYFKSTREKLYFKLSGEQNLGKFVESLYIFLTTPDEEEKYVEMMQSSSSNNCICYYNIEVFNLFDPELQMINIKPIIKNRLK